MPIFASASAIRQRLRHPLQTIAGAGRSAVTAVTGRRTFGGLPLSRIQMGSLPVGPSGAVGTAARAARGIITGAKNLGQRAMGNPLAGRTVGQFLKQRAGGALGAATFLTAVDIAAKDAISFPDIARTTVAAAFNPIGTIIGTGIRGGKAAAQGTGKLAESIFGPRFTPERNFIPDFRPNFDFDYGQPDINFTVPSFDSPSLPGNQFAPSLNLSGGVGGGGFDPTALALLLAGAGGLGFVAGRRRRKRKYKKRKGRKK